MIAVLLAFRTLCVYGTDQEQIWNKIQTAAQGKNKAETVHILAGYPLPKKLDGVSSKSCAIGSVLHYQLSPPSALMDDSGYVFPLANTFIIYQKQKLGDDSLVLERNKMKDIFAEQAGAIIQISQSMKRRYKAKFEETTPLVENILFIENTFSTENFNGNLQREIENFAHARLQKVNLFSSLAEWEYIINRLIQNLPLIITNNDEYYVIVGSYETNSNKYILLYDSDESAFRISSGEDNVPKSEKNSTDPKINAFNQWLMNRVFLFDYTVILSRPKPPGLKIVEFSEIADMSCISFDFVPDVEKIDFLLSKSR